MNKIFTNFSGVRFLWLTDTCLSEQSDVYEWLHSIMECKTDFILHTGSMSSNAKSTLELLYSWSQISSASMPCYYILGNQDYCGTDIRSVREDLKRMNENDRRENVLWLDGLDYVPINEQVALLGMDNFIDANQQDTENEINITYYWTNYGAGQLYEKLNMAYQAGFRKLLVAMHALPFIESYYNANHEISFQNLSFVHSQAIGSVLERFVQSNLDASIQVFCSHTQQSKPYQHPSPAISVEVGKTYEEQTKLFQVISHDYHTQHLQKVIFLDIDGVLQPLSARKRFDHDLIKLQSEFASKDQTYADMNRYDIGAVYYDWHEQAIFNLKKLCQKYNAKIVVSSAWRERKSKNHLLKLFALHDLDQYVVDTTPILERFGVNRADEVSLYLKQHPHIHDYVILDDCDFNFPKQFPNNFVKCDYFFDDACLQMASKCLQ